MTRRASLSEALRVILLQREIWLHSVNENIANVDHKKEEIDIISGSEYNFKITTPEDIKIAEKLFLNV